MKLPISRGRLRVAAAANAPGASRSRAASTSVTGPFPGPRRRTAHPPARPGPAHQPTAAPCPCARYGVRHGLKYERQGWVNDRHPHRRDTYECITQPVAQMTLGPARSHILRTSPKAALDLRALQLWREFVRQAELYGCATSAHRHADVVDVGAQSYLIGAPEL
jgi:hypothetical protein